MVKHLSPEDNFEEIIKKDIYLVDFYAEWCGPCKMLAPILEEIDFVSVLKINTDEFPELATKFGIMSIPTLIFFKDGKEVQKAIGFRSLEDIKDIFENIEK